MIEAQTGVPFQATLDNAPPGLVGVVTVGVFGPTGSPILAPSTSAITGVEVPVGSGSWVYTATRTVNFPVDGGYVSWNNNGVIVNEELNVTSTPAFGGLISLFELRQALGIDPTDTRKDDLYEQAIAYASRAIINFTERDFGVALVTEERTYDYDGSGYLDIDDATAITAVKITVPAADDIVLASDEWRAMPNRRDDSPVFYYLLMPGIYGLGGSPEMGFTKNLDVYAAEGRWRALPPYAKVTGTWGWATVPDDVKQAVIWTVQDWTERIGGEALAAEAIEGWSRSWATRGGQLSAALAIPNRARDILSHYQKLHV